MVITIQLTICIPSNHNLSKRIDQLREDWDIMDQRYRGEIDIREDEISHLKVTIYIQKYNSQLYAILFLWSNLEPSTRQIYLILVMMQDGLIMNLNRRKHLEHRRAMKVL